MLIFIQEIIQLTFHMQEMLRVQKIIVRHLKIPHVLMLIITGIVMLVILVKAWSSIYYNSRFQEFIYG